MSAKKGSEANSVVVGGTKKNRVGPRTRLAFLGLLALVVVGAIGFGGWLIYEKEQGGGSKAGETSKIPQQAQKMTEINGKPVTETQRSQQAIYYGEYDQGQQLLEDQIGSAKTDDAKIDLYRQLATNALNAKKYDQANAYVEKALKIKKTASLYSLLATIAATQGNKAKAIEYANEQKKLLDPKASSYARQVESIDKFIEEQK